MISTRSVGLVIDTVVCLTLDKWETVSGQFGGYLTAQPGRGPLMECVKAHFQDFTEPCKAVLVRIAAVRESCGVDIHKQCPAIKPGAGRILLCVKKHFAALSEPCKEAIGRAAERKLRA